MNATTTVSACKHEYGFPLPRDKGNFTVPATCMKCGYTPTHSPTEPTVEKWEEKLLYMYGNGQWFYTPVVDFIRKTLALSVQEAKVEERRRIIKLVESMKRYALSDTPYITIEELLASLKQEEKKV